MVNWKTCTLGTGGWPIWPAATCTFCCSMADTTSLVESWKFDISWGSSQTLILGAVSLLLVAAFVVRQSRIPNPLMPLRLFRSRNVAGANIVQALLVAGMFGMFFLGALYLQRILGYDAIETGLAFLPVSTLIGVMSLGVSARLNLRFGPRATLLPGLVRLHLL